MFIASLSLPKYYFSIYDFSSLFAIFVETFCLSPSLSLSLSFSISLFLSLRHTHYRCLNPARLFARKWLALKSPSTMKSSGRERYTWGRTSADQSLFFPTETREWMYVRVSEREREREWDKESEIDRKREREKESEIERKREREKEKENVYDREWNVCTCVVCNIVYVCVYGKDNECLRVHLFLACTGVYTCYYGSMGTFSWVRERECKMCLLTCANLCVYSLLSV